MAKSREFGRFVTRLGAEAKIELTEWFGSPAIRKTRISKSYRDTNLDNRLRVARTKAEAVLLCAAKLAAVDVPEIYHANPKAAEIVMEFAEGMLLIEINETKRRKEIFKTLGIYAARLHKKGIIHGDLTTKNAIHTADGRTILIDFGLAFISDRLEDKAEDMHLLKQAIRSSGVENSKLFDHALRGYAEESGSKTAFKVRNHILEIDRRGRYARVD